MFLYIDPGTGSMLFSIFIGIAAALYYFFKLAVIKIKFLLTGKRLDLSATHENIAVYSEGKQYWNVFMPILDELERRKLSAAYFTSAEDDPFFSKNYKYICGKYINEGNKAFAFLNFLQADICLTTTPGLDVYQFKRSRGVRHYSHILHSVDDATSYEIFGLDYYDSVLLSGEYQKEGIRELEKKRGDKPKELVVVGSTYLDVLNARSAENSDSGRGNMTVLVAPSWGRNSLLSKFGKKLLDPLADSDFNVIIRPHPQSLRSESEMIKKLKQSYSDRFSWDFAPDNFSSLSGADIMISDFSSVIFDFCFLFGRPVFYAVQNFNMEIYDAGELDSEPWKFQILKEIAIEIKEEDFINLAARLKESTKDVKLLEAVQKAKAIAWQHIGESGVRCVDFLQGKLEELKN